MYAFGRPVWTDKIDIKSILDAIDDRIARADVGITPGRKHATGLQYAAYLGIEFPMIEPVQRLRNGDQAGTCIGQRRLLARLNAIFDIGMGFGLRDLIGARIGANDAREMFGQRERGLAIAAAAIPDEIAIGRLLREPGE